MGTFDRIFSSARNKVAVLMILYVTQFSLGAHAANCEHLPLPVEPPESLIIGDVGPAEFIGRSSNGSIETTVYASTVKTKKVLLSLGAGPIPDQFKLTQKQVRWLVTNDHWSAPILEKTIAVLIINPVNIGEYEFVDGRVCEP